MCLYYTVRFPTYHLRDPIQIASDPTQVWSMKRELLSPAYTTRLSDLPCVECIKPVEYR
ncbi:DUF4113 domain-containing protein [Serratia liquefaciens]|uniref:DUF4113 domain-containing protein n=1 Tax=Serratia liquefaciens TaxID=614 RepID=UPI0035261566